MWIWISVVLLVTPILFFIIAKIEFKTKGMSGYWAKLGNSAWYAFGTFFGEGITSSISSEPAWGIRYNICSTQNRKHFPPFSVWKKRLAVVTWLWYSFVVTALYSGELRAVLLHPAQSPPLDTIRDVVDLSSSWEVVDYGDRMWDPFFMRFFGKTDGIEKFYRDMTKVEYKEFPLEHASLFYFLSTFIF